MQRSVLILLAGLVCACSGENDRISASDAADTLDEVQSQLDAAGAAVESRLDDALDEVEENLE